MSFSGQTAAGLTRRAIEAADAGQVDDARQLLAEALSINPEYEPAWLRFAYMADSDEERKFCLQRAVEINPVSAAAAPLAQLGSIDSEPPQELLDLLDPPPPPELTASHGDELEKRGNNWWPYLVALLALAIGVAALVSTQRGEEELGNPLYVALVAGGVDTPGDPSYGMAHAAMLHFDQVNAAGGVEDRPLQLLTFDDQNDPEVAVEVANRIVADDRIILVIGHRTSSTSLAAAPIYAAAGIPAITSTATDDEITRASEWYFRTVFSNQNEGEVLGAYTVEVLQASNVTVIADDAAYGATLAAGFRTGFTNRNGDLRHDIVVNAETFDTDLAEAISTISTGRESEIIFIAMPANMAFETIVALRNTGITAPILAGDAAGTQAFLNQLSEREVANSVPGRYTMSFFAGAPVALDALSGEALQLKQQFAEVYAMQPDWRAFTTWEAAQATSHAVAAAMLSGGDIGDIITLRANIRDQLLVLDSEQTALRGVIGPIYFDESGTTPRSVSVVTAGAENHLVSAPIQLVRLRDNAATALAGDSIVNLAGWPLVRQQVVYSGFNLNEISDLDLQDASFYADFFLWLRFGGDDVATDIVFPNAVLSNLRLGQPVRTVEENGTTYSLFRVTGRFKSQMEFQDFPFDRQELLITFANRTEPIDRVVYVIDASLLDVTTEELIRSGLNESQSAADIPNWWVSGVRIFPETVGTSSTLGVPGVPPSASGIDYSTMSTEVTIQRNVESFLVKNILPLFFLTLVTYISLFISHSQTGARVSFGITGILTGIVLLSGVTGLLPDVDYTVAIEWAYYVFIFLSAGTILVGLVGDHLYEERDLVALRRLDLVSRIAFPAIVIAVIGVYWSRYG